jgi:hypothetical protein
MISGYGILAPLLVPVAGIDQFPLPAQRVVYSFDRFVSQALLLRFELQSIVNAN